MTSPPDPWVDALAEFAETLAVQRLAFADGRYADVVAFPFPPGPVPDDLRPLAERLLRESTELEGAAEAALDTLARRRAEATRSAARARQALPTRPVASFFDGVA